MSVLKSKKGANGFVIYVCAVVVLLFDYLPIMTGYFGAMPALPFAFLGCMLVISSNGRFAGEIGIIMLFVGLYFMGVMVSRDTEMFLGLYMVIKLMFVSFVILYLIFEGERDYVVKLFWLTVILMAITETTTIIGSTIFPDAPRFLISEGAAGSTRLYMYTRRNIGGYVIAYGLPGLFVNMMILVKKKKMKPMLFVGFVVLSLVFCAKAQFTISLILSVISIVIICVSFKRPQKLFRNVLIVTIIAVLSVGEISMFLETISKDSESIVISERFGDVSKILEGDKVAENSAAEARMEAYDKTLTLLKEEFILGGMIFGKRGGGHSSIGDFLAYYGILGWILLITMFSLMYKRIYKGKKGDLFYQAIVFSQILYIIPLLVNQIYSAGFFWPMFGLSTATVYMAWEDEKNEDEEDKESVIE